MKILVVEDSEKLRKYLIKGLEHAGFAVDIAGDGEEGQWYAENNDYDVIVLDLMMPKVDGMTMLKAIREKEDHPHVLVLTAKASLEDKVNGLKEGADDYLTKPFALQELVARIHALIRRKYGIQKNQIQTGALTIDLDARSVRRDAIPLNLRPREFALLEFLAANQGRVVSRSAIEMHLYDYAQDVMSNVVDASICMLRKAIDTPGRRSYITTVFKQGYVFKEPDHVEHVT